MIKSEAIRLIHTTHGRLLTLLDNLSDADWVAPGVEGEWSVKDIAAHLLYWEQVVADDLTLFASGQIPRAIPASEIETLNQRNNAYHRGRSVADIRIDLHHAMQALPAALDALTEDVLQGPCIWDGGKPVIETATNEMEHWQAHITAIKTWLDA